MLAATTSTDFVCICQLSVCIIHVELQWIANTKYRPNEVHSLPAIVMLPIKSLDFIRTHQPNGECNRICVPCNLQSTSTRFYCHRLQTSRNSADCERCDFTISELLKLYATLRWSSMLHGLDRCSSCTEIKMHGSMGASQGNQRKTFVHWFQTKIEINHFIVHQPHFRAVFFFFEQLYSAIYCQ